MRKGNAMAARQCLKDSFFPFGKPLSVVAPGRKLVVRIIG
jgi:hypothetical protein